MTAVNIKLQLITYIPECFALFFKTEMHPRDDSRKRVSHLTRGSRNRVSYLNPFEVQKPVKKPGFSPYPRIKKPGFLLQPFRGAKTPKETRFLTSPAAIDFPQPNFSPRLTNFPETTEKTVGMMIRVGLPVSPTRGLIRR
jgi:hypothetical protein